MQTLSVLRTHLYRLSDYADVFYSEPISVNAPPVSFTWNDQIYYIVEDTRVQEMVFISGLPQALNVNMDILQPVLERRTDTLFPPNKRATAFEVG